MGQVKLTPEDVKQIKELTSERKYTDRVIAEMFCVSRGHITKIRNKKRWNYDYESKAKGPVEDKAYWRGDLI